VAAGPGPAAAVPREERGDQVDPRRPTGAAPQPGRGGRPPSLRVDEVSSIRFTVAAAGYGLQAPSGLADAPSVQSGSDPPIARAASRMNNTLHPPEGANSRTSNIGTLPATATVETWRVTLDHIRQRLLAHGTGVVDERSRSRSPTERGALATASRVAPAFGGNGYRIRLAAVSSARSMVPRGPCAVGWAAAGGSLPTRAGGSSNLLRSAHANGANGSTVVGELALRRDSHPKPECHRRRVPRHEARRLGYWF